MKRGLLFVALFAVVGGVYFSSPSLGGNNVLMQAASAKSITEPDAAKIPVSVPGTLSLIAGNLDGPGSSDGDRSTARFGDGQTPYGNRPVGITRDARGNLYVADVTNHTIRKITPAGIVSTLAGKAGESGRADGPGANARFKSPSGIAIDAKGTLYVADTANDLIRKISPAGVVTTLTDLQKANGSNSKNTPPARVSIALDANSTGGTYKTQDIKAQSPMGIAVDAQGQVYVAVTFSNSILRISPNGVVSTLAGQPKAVLGIKDPIRDGIGADALFNEPKGLAVDRSGVAYVADCGNDAIRTITPAGAVTTLVGRRGNEVVQGAIDGPVAVARIRCPSGIALDNAGNLYVTDEHDDMIRKISSDGVVSTMAGNPDDGRGSVDGVGDGAKFNTPTGLVLDPSGNVYVADSRNAAIRKVTPQGVVTTVAGRMRRHEYRDGIGAEAKFVNPLGMTTDKQGNLYVSDADANYAMIRKISPQGVVTRLVGKYQALYSSDWAWAPDYPGATGIAMDGAGYFYLVDYSRQIIRKMSPAGEIKPFAGTVDTENRGWRESADGPALQARFVAPNAIALDSSGNTYVTDGQTIRKIDASGAVTTFAGKAVDSFDTKKSNDGTGQNARFQSFGGIAIDAAGYLYVPDHTSIRRISPAGVVTTIAGSLEHSGSMDGVGSNALFDGPGNPVFDSAGNLYVTDGGSTVRKITPEGVVTTVAGVVGKRGLQLGSPGLLEGPHGMALIAPKVLALISANAVLKLTLP